MKIDCFDETKTIPSEYSFIRGCLEGMIGRKPLGMFNSVTRSITSATEMRSNSDKLNIKVIPLSDLKLCMLKTLSLEAILLAFCTLPKSDVNTYVMYDANEKLLSNYAIKLFK